MAYARYFKRNGKTFGPYYYESYRDENGKVKKRYVGTVDSIDKLKENIEMENKIEEKDTQEISNNTPASFYIGILVILVIILVLMDVLFLFFWLG